MSRKPLTKRQKMAVLDAVLVLNAAILGERQDVYATAGPKGWVRVGYRRGVVNAPRPYDDVEPRSYPDIDVAIEAARVSLRRALAIYEDLNGTPHVYADVAS